jgi:hypothetical protein
MSDYLIIAHRVNTIEGLEKIPAHYGVEIDVRHNSEQNRLYLNHDPGEPSGTYADLDDYLSHFKHAFVIFNIKEAGIEGRCIELAAKHGIPKSNYFLLDVEFPYLYRASRKEGVREIAVRYSEAEPIEMTTAQRGLVDWAWIDTNTTLPLDTTVAEQLKGFKTCLVSPDRWGRPQDIPVYRAKIEELHFPLTAVMVGMEHVRLWE